MDTEIIRQKIFDYVKVADDEKLEAIYTIIKDDGSEPYEWWNDEELIAELDRRSADLKSGNDPGFTLEQSKERVKLMLKKNGWKNKNFVHSPERIWRVNIIVYEILKKENVINVLHIFHTSRNPKFKFKKK